MQVSRDRKRVSLKDVHTGEVLCEGSKIVMESYLDGYFDEIENKLGSRLPNPTLKSELTQYTNLWYGYELEVDTMVFLKFKIAVLVMVLLMIGSKKTLVVRGVVW